MISSDALASNGSERATTRKEQWYVETRAGILPMTSDAIEESLRRGVLQASTKIWKSGMQAWQPLGAIAYFTPQADEPSSQLSARAPLHEVPAPEANPFDWGPDSLTPAPAPVHTLIRPVAPGRRGARAQVKAAQPPREQGGARGIRTWQRVLFSAVAGTALGLAVYHPQLWRASTPPVSPIAEQTPQRAATTLAAAVPVAAAVPLPQPAPPEPIGARAETAAGSASALVAQEAVPTPPAKRSSVKRSKLARRKLRQRPERTELPAWP